MWVWIDRLGATILDAGMAAAVLLGLAALAMVGCRQPSRRCSLARAAIVASLALIGLAAYGPSRPKIDVVEPLRLVLAPVLSPGAEPLGGTTAVVASRSAVADWNRGLAVLGRWAPRALTVAYLLGALASLATLILGWWFSCWLIQRAAEPAACTREVYAALPFVRARRPRLRVAPRLRRPVLLGIVRPVILILPELDRPEAREQLRLSLLHELAHAERRDPWFSLAGSLSLAAWFFVPWLWWIRHQMRLDQEFLADHKAAEGFGTFGTYASSLVELADPGPSPPNAAPAPEFRFWGAGSALFQRVLMLVRCPYPVETRTPRWWRWGLLPVVACGTLLVSGLTLQSAQPHTTGLGSAAPASSSDRSFHLSRLVIAESPPGPDGLTAPYNLPLALPEQFELSLEIWAQPPDLALTRVAGCRLGPLEAGTAAVSAAPSWHTVQIRREGMHDIVRVDELPVAADPDADPGLTWLSIQPAPNRLGLVRNVVMTW